MRQLEEMTGEEDADVAECLAYSLPFARSFAPPVQLVRTNTGSVY